MSGEVITMEAGRQQLQERLEAKERFKRRRIALGISSAPTSFPTAFDDSWNPEELPKWPGGIDDMEIGE